MKSAKTIVAKFPIKTMVSLLIFAALQSKEFGAPLTMAAMKAQTYRRIREIAAVGYTNATGSRRSPQYSEYLNTNKYLSQSHSAHLRRVLPAINI